MTERDAMPPSPAELPADPAARVERLAADQAAHVAEFQGIDLAEAQARMAQGGETMAREWSAQSPASGRVAEFYSRTQSYLYELAQFTNRDRLAYLQEIHSQYLRPGDAFLDYGAGSGDLGLMFAGRCRVCSLDVPGRTQAYAKFRAGKYGQPIEFVNQIPTGRAFSAISAQDVLEHLEEPYGHVENMARALAPGGWLLTSGFWFNPDIPLHLAENARFKESFVRDFATKFDLWLEKIFARPTGAGSFVIGAFRKKKPKYPVKGIEYHTGPCALEHVDEECVPGYICELPPSDI